MLVHYKYTCINQNDEIVADGEFDLDVEGACNVRNPKVSEKGHFEMIFRERELFSYYRGANHLKEVRMTATNVITGCIREI